MPVQITRRQVEWDRASCRGLDTKLFYLMRGELADEGFSYNYLRRMCFDCPIQKECLQIGTSMERYGFWGGLSEEERTAIYESSLHISAGHIKVLDRLKRDLQFHPGKYQELQTIVHSVKRVFGIFDFTGRPTSE